MTANQLARKIIADAIRRVDSAYGRRDREKPGWLRDVALDLERNESAETLEQFAVAASRDIDRLIEERMAGVSHA